MNNGAADEPVARDRPRHVAAAGYRPPYAAAAAASAAVWLLYVATLAPTTWFWDTSEYIATAHILGIPHPPGNPLFVVLARAWELLLAPTGLSVAARINLFSATMGALAHGFWFLLAHRILAFYSPNRAFRLVGAAVAVLISATAFTVWNQSNVNEKVYTVSLFTIALLSWLAFRWRDTDGEWRYLLLLVYVLALSLGNHLMAALAAPALLVFMALARPAVFKAGRLYAAAAAVAILGISIHLFLPLRAELGPVINEAHPACESLAEAVNSIGTWGRGGCDALSSSLTREQYNKPSIFKDPTDLRIPPLMPRTPSLFAAQVVNYLQYFDWQWARSVAGRDTTFGGLRPLFTLLFAALGLFGAVTHYRKDRTSWAYVAVLFATLSVGLVFYLNFKYGFALFLDRFPDRDAHEVRERDYFFLVGFSVWGVWAGIGLAALWQRMAARLGGLGSAGLRPYALASPLLALALLPLALNWGWAKRSHDFAARDWAYNLLMSVEPYGVLFTNGDNDTFPLWYLQEVEGIRQDVTVIVTSYLNTPWYVKQLRQLTAPCPEGVSAADDPTRIICQRPFRAVEGPGLHAAGPPADRPGRPLGELRPPERAPSQSIIRLTDEQIAAIAASPVAVREPLALRAGRVETTIRPGTVLFPSDTFITAILVAAVGDRPIHFMVPSPPTELLSLQPYLVRHGLTYRLNDGPVEVEPGGPIVEMPDSPVTAITGRYVDLAVMDTLLDEVFVHRTGIPDDWDVWVDSATLNIPTWYMWAHLAAAYAHEVMGREDRAMHHYGRADAWRRLAQI